MWSGSRRPTTSSLRAWLPPTTSLVERLAALGAPPSALIGVRNAFERRSGHANAPVGPALLGTVFAVIALCGTGVFGASLSHLTATPKLFGDATTLPGGCDDNPSLAHQYLLSITNGYYRSLLGEQLRTPIRRRISPRLRAFRRGLKGTSSASSEGPGTGPCRGAPGGPRRPVARDGGDGQQLPFRTGARGQGAPQYKGWAT